MRQGLIARKTPQHAEIGYKKNLTDDVRPLQSDRREYVTDFRTTEETVV